MADRKRVGREGSKLIGRSGSPMYPLLPSTLPGEAVIGESNLFGRSGPPNVPLPPINPPLVAEYMPTSLKRILQNILGDALRREMPPKEFY